MPSDEILGAVSKKFKVPYETLQVLIGHKNRKIYILSIINSSLSIRIY